MPVARFPAFGVPGSLLPRPERMGILPPLILPQEWTRLRLQRLIRSEARPTWTRSPEQLAIAALDEALGPAPCW